MSNTLNKIQKISKFFKVIYKIVYVFCIVGLILTTIGLVLTIIAPNIVEIVDINISNFIEGYDKLKIHNAYSSIVTALISLISEIVITKMGIKYFEYELKEGTPFTYEGADKLKKLGIYTIVVPIVTAIIIGVVYAGMYLAMPDIKELDYENYTSISLGIFYIITSLICRYGTEVSNKENKEVE